MYSRDDLRRRLTTGLARGFGEAAEEPEANESPAAVLVPVMLGGDEPRLLFTRRTDSLSRHAGEISFPGGLADPGESPAATALRESAEEVGIRPGEVEVLGTLPPVHTRVTRILITPVVGLIGGAPTLRPNEAEIAEMLRLPVAELREADRDGFYDYRGFRIATIRFDVGRTVIWGATARILRSFFDVLKER